MTLRESHRQPFSLMLGVGAALFILLDAAPARPQPAPPPAVQTAPVPPAVQTAPAPPQEESPGLIHEMGKLFERIVPPLKSPGETVDDLSRAAKPSTMVSGRMACPFASNGAPDCKVGADKLCQSKGYSEGKSLNLDSAESCSAKVLIPGRQRKPDDCRTNTYVTSALCQ